MCISWAALTAPKPAGTSCAEQNYGRILVTTSSSGLYGNFGQTNYVSAAKMGVIGMMNTLAQEGAKNNVRINALHQPLVHA